MLSANYITTLNFIHYLDASEEFWDYINTALEEGNSHIVK